MKRTTPISSPPMPNSSTSALAIMVVASKVIGRAYGKVVEQKLLGLSTAQQDAQIVEKLALRNDEAMRAILIADVAESPGSVAANRDAFDRRGMIAKHCGDRVSRFVNGDNLFLGRCQLRQFDILDQARSTSAATVASLRFLRIRMRHRPAQGVEMVAAVASGRANDVIVGAPNREIDGIVGHFQLHLFVVNLQ